MAGKLEDRDSNLNGQIPDAPWRSLVGLGDFTHVVVGSAELALPVFEGSVSPGHALAVLLPTLAGNVVGGTGLLSLLAYAQIKSEI